MFLFEPHVTIAVAVSGGSDSMALLHLLHSVLSRSSQPPPARGGEALVAVTVEHGLRAESLTEAKAVGTWCKQHNIEHHILPWTGTKPKTAVHEAARAARYELLENFCRQHHILHLATAHHADDQAETILQRIAKASGPHGLSGMAEHSFTPQLHLWRPLLHVRKSELVNYCEVHKIPCARDPSNENEKYARGRLRGAAEVLAAEGLTVENLGRLAQKQREMVRVLESEAVRFLATHAKLIPVTRAEISMDSFRAAPVAVQQTALEYVLKLVGQHHAPIRYDNLASLCAALSVSEFRAKTLGYCRIASKRISKQDFILITPENAATRKA